MTAVTQVRHRHSEGRAYYDRKVKEGKTHKEALRSLKRRTSDAIFAHLVADAKHKAGAAKPGPGGQRGNGSVSSATGSNPQRRLFGQATPEPVPTICPPVTSSGSDATTRRERNHEKHLDNKEASNSVVFPGRRTTFWGAPKMVNLSFASQAQVCYPTHPNGRGTA